MNASRRRAARALFEPTESASLLEVLDSLLNKGVVATGDVILGVAGVDLVYLRLSTLISAVDRVTRPPSLTNRSASSGETRRRAKREGGHKRRR